MKAAGVRNKAPSFLGETPGLTTLRTRPKVQQPCNVNNMNMNHKSLFSPVSFIRSVVSGVLAWSIFELMRLYFDFDVDQMDQYIASAVLFFSMCVEVVRFVMFERDKYWDEMARERLMKERTERITRELDAILLMQKESDESETLKNKINAMESNISALQLELEVLREKRAKIVNDSMWEDGLERARRTKGGEA